MPDALFYLQLIGGALSIVISAGIVISAAYSVINDTPNFLKRLTGQNKVEDSLTTLHDSVVLTQHLQLQQAEQFNQLSRLVCREHDIEDEDRPSVSTRKIRFHLMHENPPDFTQNGAAKKRPDREKSE